MVVVRLTGGLGNQMFQYAAGRRLAHVLRTSIKLDITSFTTDKLRDYSLSRFAIREEIATPADIADFNLPQQVDYWPIPGRLRGRLKKLILSYRRKVVFSEECIGPVNPELLRATRDAYLDGYWQSEKYFADIQERIRREFTLKCDPDPANRDLAALITSSKAVSLHVRRGDYVNDPHTSLIHGTCSFEYYQQCVSELGGRIAHPHFFIFSDDPTWVAKNLHLDYPTTHVTHNTAKDYEDLRLMSLCSHHIIANSSFSWWGAWLSPNPAKLVFAPSRWFNDPVYDTRDLIPESWIRVRA